MKEYLGDGLYVDYEDRVIVLSAEDGVSVQNIVYLEPQVLRSFEAFVRRLPDRENSDNST
jgi:hypothetical protein